MVRGRLKDAIWEDTVKVTPIGNGAHIIVPKYLEGKTVKLTLEIIDG